MKYWFCRVPVMDATYEQDELNRFCSSHRIVQVDKAFVDAGDQSFWTFCVGYLDAKGSPSTSRSRVDYREVLNEQDFTVFARLREVRKTLAEREAVPPYAIFTNEQLAQMVQRRVQSRSAMREIDGIGEARIEKYADAMLKLLVQMLPSQGDETATD